MFVDVFRCLSFAPRQCRTYLPESDRGPFVLRSLLCCRLYTKYGARFQSSVSYYRLDSDRGMVPVRLFHCTSFANVDVCSMLMTRHVANSVHQQQAGIVVGFLFAIGFASQRKDPSNTGLLIELSGWFSIIANVITIAVVQLVFNRLGVSWMINDDQRKCCAVCIIQLNPCNRKQ